MQAEAGQGLNEIVARKERERRLGSGLFMWGVGNPPAALTGVLARLGQKVPVVFSIMKTRPKLEDVSPGRTLVWRRYIDCHGVERMLPEHVLLTSRGDTRSRPKRSHYALMCHSDAPLRLERDEPFDPSAYRNAGGTGAPVGASQVTALLRQVSGPNQGGDYRANLRAWLTGSYWVRLTDPLELSAEKVSAIANEADVPDAEWVEFVRQMSTGPIDPGLALGRQGQLF